MCAATNHILEANTFAELLRQASERCGHLPFLIDDELLGQVSYADVQRFVAGIGAQLDELRVPVGSSVATVLHNCGLAALLFLGVIANRRRLVPLNPIASASEIGYMLNHSECTTVVFDPTHTKCSDFWSRKSIVVADHKEYFRQRSLHGQDASQKDGGPRDVTAFVGEVVYTSGSTGRPKGAVLSEQNLLANARALAEVYCLASTDRFLTVCPMFHNSGQVFTTLACALVGGATAAVRSDIGMVRFWHYVDKYRAHWSLGMVSFLAWLLGQSENPDGQHKMRGLLTGGSAIDAGLVQQFESRFSVPVRTVYGLTESSSIATCEYLDPMPRSLGSSGRPLPACDVRIGSAPEEFAAPSNVSSQTRGEIWISGPTIFDHYVGDPDLTRHRKHEGWLRTGDLGYFDDNGNLFVVDRADSMLIVGGENIYPAEIERLCTTLPNAAQIVLVGTEDQVWGTRLTLVYQAAPETRPKISHWHRILAESVAPFKVPQRYVDVRDLGLEDFPRKANGKLDRQRIASLVRDRLASNS